MRYGDIVSMPDLELARSWTRVWAYSLSALVRC